MKKTLLTAAFAAFALSAAQAVSLSWSGTAGQSNGTLTLGSLNESFVLTAKITLTDETPEGFTNNAPVIGFGNFIDANNQYNGLVWYNGSNGVGAHFGNTWLDAEVPAYAADGQNTHTYTLTFTANADGDGWDVTLTIDGTDVLVASTDNAIDWQNKTPLSPTATRASARATWTSPSPRRPMPRGRSTASPCRPSPSRRRWRCWRWAWRGWRCVVVWHERPFGQTKGPRRAGGFFWPLGQRAGWGRGRRRVKTVPWPGAERTSTEPWWRRATCLTMARPRPVPPFSRERSAWTR